MAARTLAGMGAVLLAGAMCACEAAPVIEVSRYLVVRAWRTRAGAAALVLAEGGSCSAGMILSLCRVRD